MEVQGRSILFNVIFIITNLIGISIVAMGFHDSQQDHANLLQTTGYALTIGSFIGLYIFKGYKLFGYVARVIVGGLFIVSGLIKANDPLGFSYKLEEYFEDGALAYRIKDLGWETFTLEGLIDYALFLSILVCIAEIILGVALLLGAKIKLTLWSLFGLTVFFGLLTAHTMECDAHGTFTDVDYFEPKDEEYEFYKGIDTSADTTYQIIEENGLLRVQKEKMLQCVNDCGCFGDALKGSVGRSLTPKESFWKDAILFYLIIVIILAYSNFDKLEIRKPVNAVKIGLLGLSFVAFWFTGMISPFVAVFLILSVMGLIAIGETEMNNARENLILIPASAIVVLFFCWVFGWYFPLAFAMLTLVGCLLLRRNQNQYVQNEWTLALFATIVSASFVWYVLNYLPLKDYRAYAIGENLVENMITKKPPVFSTIFTYENISTGELEEFNEKELATNKDLMDNTKYKWVSSDTRQVDPGIPAKITDFEPFAYLDSLPERIQNSEKVQELLNQSILDHYYVDTMMTVMPLLPEYGISPDTILVRDYDTSMYNIDIYQPGPTFVHKERINPDAPINLNFKNYILEQDKIFLMVCYDIEKSKKHQLEKVKEMYQKCLENKIDFYLLSASSSKKIKEYIAEIDPEIPVLSGDDKELKIVVRSNPGYVALSNAVVKGKWSFKSLPSFEELEETFKK